MTEIDEKHIMLMGGDSMSMIFFTFRAQTKAKRSTVMLQKMGISARLGKTPGTLAVNGCGYGVWVPEVQGIQAARVLRKAELQFEKSYRMDGVSPLEVRL